MEERELFIQMAGAAVAAGAEILRIYSGGFEVKLKDDQSPLTAADEAAHRILTTELADISFRGKTVPVISEEGEIPPFNERKDWNYFWLVDPLDGTKEFINGNGEFTVNIALMEKDHPLLGLVYLPVKKMLYFGGKRYGSFRTDASDTGLKKTVSLPVATEKDPDLLRVAGSRSHRSDKFDGWVKAEADRRGCSRVEVITAGSSLKFCLVAEGAVDVYPRFGPTMEWDTAAAHAVAEGAGKTCTEPDGSEMHYNKNEMKNNAFVVW